MTKDKRMIILHAIISCNRSTFLYALFRRLGDFTKNRSQYILLRCIFSLSLSLSIPFPFGLSLSLSIPLPYTSLYLLLYPSPLHLSLSPPLSLSFSLSDCLPFLMPRFSNEILTPIF